MRKALVRKGFAFAVLMAFVLLMTGLAMADTKAKETAIAKYQETIRAQMALAKAETAKYDATEKAAAAGAAVAHKASVEAAANQDKVCKVVGMVPVLGLAMRQYNAGEMRAYYKGKGNESYWGVVHAFFKLPASLPEHAAFDFLFQFTGSNWRELDPITVFLVEGRPYWLDLTVTGTKIFFHLAGAGAITGAAHHGYHAHHAHHVSFVHYGHHADKLLPLLGGHTGAVGQAFLWGAAGGGGYSVVAGTLNQGAKKLSPFRQYYKNYRNWTGEASRLNL
jgi:hypothetical protein